MSVPRKRIGSYQCKSGLDKGLATSSAPNLTHGEVTSRVKLGEGRYQATTQVKV